MRSYQIGRWGENLAKEFIENQGYSIIDHNVYTSHGELDIIAQKGEEIVFFEVKTRTSQKFGFPEEAVTKQKMQHLIDSALTFLQNYPHLNVQWRIDVITVEGSPKSSSIPEINWYKNAVQ